MQFKPWVAIVLAGLLFGILYFLFDNSPPQSEGLEKTRLAMGDEVSVNSFRESVLKELTTSEKATLLELESLVDTLKGEEKTEAMKRISGAWFALDAYPVAGWEAAKVAKELGTAEAWGITGTTYTLCLQRSKDEKAFDFCRKQGVNAFESAISLDPEDPSHKVNLALLYTEAPPKENPMQGITMLLDLNKKYPENVNVLVTLARLGVRTNQWEKAYARLEKALKLEPTNVQANCLMADVLSNLGKENEAAAYASRCK